MSTSSHPADDLHPEGAERPSEAAMREAAQHDAPVEPVEAPTSKPKAAAKKPAGPKKGSARAAVAKVLADGQPRSSKEITAAAAKLATGLTGKTPEASLRALLSTEAKKADGLVEPGPDKGTYRLRPTA
jgi:hypothetical protein